MGWRPLRDDEGRGPVPLRASIERLLHSLGAPAPGPLAVVFDDWASLVGARIAEHATPVSIADGCLTVRVQDPAWAHELKWLERDIVTRIGARIGPGTVTSLQVRVGIPDRPTRVRGGRAQRR